MTQAPRPLNLETVRTCLQAQVGRDQALKAAEIVELATGQRSSADRERRLRELIKQLRLAGDPVCSHSAHGYYWAAEPQEIEAACQWLRGKALSSLAQVSTLRRVALPPVAGQLTLLGAQPAARPPVPLVLELPEELHAAATQWATEQGCTMDALIRESVRHWLDQEGAL